MIIRKDVLGRKIGNAVQDDDVAVSERGWQWMDGCMQMRADESITASMLNVVAELEASGYFLIHQEFCRNDKRSSVRF